MIKMVMFILCPLWVAMVLVLMVIDIECMYKAVVTFDTIDCFMWIIWALSLAILEGIVSIGPILMYNDFKD
jgi:hypothetical protein